LRRIGTPGELLSIPVRREGLPHLMYDQFRVLCWLRLHAREMRAEQYMRRVKKGAN